MLTLSLKKHRVILLLSVIIVSLIIVVRDVLMINISNIFLLFLFIALFICLSYSELLSFVFFIIPLTCGIPGYFILLAVIFLILKGKSWSFKQLIPFFAIIVLESINEITTPGSSILGIISFLSFIATFFYYLNLESSELNKDECIVFFSLGVILVFFVIYYNMIMQYGISELLSGAMRTGALGAIDNDIEKMEGHLALNANSIAYYAICAFSSLVVGFRRMSYNQAFLTVLIVCCLILGFLSFSRTYLLCVLLFAVLFLLFQDRNNRNAFFFIGIVLVLILFFLGGDFLESLFDVFTDRIERDDFSTAGGRILIFRVYNQIWSSNIFYVIFGCGAVSYKEKLGMVQSIHSGLQQIWVCLGISGFSIFLIEILQYFRKYVCRYNLGLVIPFFIALVFDQSIQFLNPYSLMLPILAPLLVLQLQKN